MRYVLCCAICCVSFSRILAESPTESKIDSEITVDYRAMQKAREGTGSSPFIVEHGPRRFASWKQAAERGDVRAMILVGRCLQEAAGVPADKQEALRWFHKAADSGNAVAMYYIGYCSANGEGTEVDPQQAIAWYQKSASAGDGSAMCNLGYAYQVGHGIEQNLALSLEWYRKGATLGVSTCMYGLGLCYQHGRGVPQDMPEALRWFRKASDAGDAQAMCALGECYANGAGVKQDDSAAAEWYRKSAAAGNGIAMANLGDCYSTGRGVTQSDKDAFEWYQKGAETGNEHAMSNLASCYRSGKGVRADLQQATHWEQKLARLQSANQGGPETPGRIMLRAIQAAQSHQTNADLLQPNRIPTLDEYLAMNWKLVLDDDPSNDAEAHYRIGCLMEIVGPHPDYSTESLKEASKEFLIASSGLPGKPEYDYLYFRMEFLLSTAADPKKDPRLVTLQNMLMEKDLRYFGYSSSGRILSVNFLVLLLEDDRFQALALHELKTLDRVELATLPQYLTFPRYSGTRVEELLLKAMAGREAEITSEARAVLQNLSDFRYPLIERYEAQLIRSEVETFTPAEIRELPGGRAQAERIRARQMDEVIARTRPALNYLRSRIKLLQGIVDRGEANTPAAK